jgi:iron complex outermembrane receptor protein
MGHLGFRSDWELAEADTLTIQGDVYDGNFGELQPRVSLIGRQGPQGTLRVKASGGNILSRWQHTSGDDSDFQLRFYYDHTHRDDPSFRDDLDTLDLDFQQRLALGRNELVWGLNYRLTDDDNRRGIIFALDPQTSRDTLISGFVQDQITLRDSLRLTLGTKLEHNDFSGSEIQPSVRLAWDLARDRTLWAAVSRAVRVPTRLERDVAIDASNPAGNPVLRLLGNAEFDSEEVLAYELGFRWLARESLAFDLAAFCNRYEVLASLEFGTPFVSPVDGRTIIPIVNENRTDGRALGFEALTTYAPLRNWRLTASYSYFDLELDPHGLDLNRGKRVEGATPRHQLSLRSSLDLPHDFELDATFRSVSELRSLPQIVSGPGIPGYSELDLRLAWAVRAGLDLVIAGQNLLHDHHDEFGAPAARGENARSVYGKVVFRH